MVFIWKQACRTPHSSFPLFPLLLSHFSSPCSLQHKFWKETNGVLGLRDVQELCSCCTGKVIGTWLHENTGENMANTLKCICCLAVLDQRVHQTTVWPPNKFLFRRWLWCHCDALIYPDGRTLTCCWTLKKLCTPVQIDLQQRLWISCNLQSAI